MLLLSVAFAADPFVDAGFILSAPDSGAWVGGLGAPSVEYDPVNAQYVLFFESPAPASEVPEVCANSYRIGRAVSPDGLSWTVDETPVITPELGVEGSLRACSVSQPAVVYDGSAWNLFFTQSGEKDAYGINTPNGVAWATSTDGVTFTVTSQAAIPADASGLGLASATVYDDALVLVYSQTFDLYVATRPLSGGDWTRSAAPIVDHLALGDRAGTWTFGASASCDVTTPLTMVIGMDTADGARSLAYAQGTDALTWTVDTDALDSSGLDTSALNHWDRMLWADGSARLWYSKTDDVTGLKAIGVATAGAPAAAPLTRGCLPEPVDTGDTGDTGLDTGDTTIDTADSGDTGAPDSADTGKSEVTGDGCNCASGGAGALGALPALLALFGLRRRR